MNKTIIWPLFADYQKRYKKPRDKANWRNCGCCMKWREYSYKEKYIQYKDSNKKYKHKYKQFKGVTNEKSKNDK